MSEFTVNHKAYTTSIHLKKNEHEFDLMSKINAKITERDNLALEAQIHSNIKSLNEVSVNTNSRKPSFRNFPHNTLTRWFCLTLMLQ